MSEQTLSELGPRLRARRLQCGRPTEAVALHVARCVETIRAYEKGYAVPPLKVLVGLADFYEVTLDELVGSAREGAA
jgi:transcriptional regulator with XRE-family HTH domain